MLNKAIIMGRLTADPELKHTTTNIPVTSFSVAVNRSYSRSSDQQNNVDFIDVVAWRNTAEFITKYFSKGVQIAISGRIQTRNWKDQNGGNHKAVEIVADEVFFADSKKSDNSNSKNNASFSDFDAKPASDFSEIADIEDELPF